MDLNELSVFIKVIQEGSFNRAGRALGMPNSTVSAKVSALEKRLGVTLIQRTTRKLNLTPAGRDFYVTASEAMQVLAAAEAELRANQQKPSGTLKITAPVELGAVLLPTVIEAYAKRWPEVNLRAHLSDERVDLIDGGFDLAIRAGDLKDSGDVAKKLGNVAFALFASPKYLKTAAKIKDPADLKAQTCLQFTYFGLSEWKLTNGRGQRSIALPGKVVINDLNTLKAMAVAGQGVALLPSFFCHNEVLGRDLVRVLPEWRTQMNPVHFVYPAQKFVPSRVRAFIEVAEPLIKQRLAQNSL